MANSKLQLFLPAGRIVMGNVYKPNPIGMDGKVKAKPEYFFGLAVAKNHPEIPALLNAMWNFAMAATAQYPHIQNRVKLGLVPGSGFAWKIGDGDQPDTEGKLYDERRGCHIFKVKTTWPIRCTNRDNQDIAAELVRTGFWADGAFNIDFNGKTDHTAGIYLNPVFVRLLWQDKEIVTGPKASEVFKDRAAPPPPAGAQGGGMPGNGMPGAGGGHSTHGMGSGGGAGGQQYQQNAGGMPGAGAANPPQPSGAMPASGMPGAGGHVPSSGVTGITSASNQPAPSLSPMPMGNGGSHAPATDPRASAPMNTGIPSQSAAPAAPAAPIGQSDNSAFMAAEVERLVAERLAMGNGQTAMTGGGGAPATTAGGEMGNGGHAGGQAVPGGASAAPGAGYTDPVQGSQIASPSEGGMPGAYNPHPQFLHGGQA